MAHAGKAMLARARSSWRRAFCHDDAVPQLPIRYPIFVPSKGRSHACQTAKFLLADSVPFRLVVEPSEEHDYRQAFPSAELLVTPHDDMRLLGVRNWIRQRSIDEGHDRHWQLDDNIRRMKRQTQGKRLSCNARIAISAVEQFTDRYTNIGVSGMDYSMFAKDAMRPFRLNVHVYSCTLVNNRMPYTWRLVYNDDTDLCLQVLSGGMCTVQFQAFVVEKMQTMTVSGGNTDDLYRGDGRLTMSRTLERQWPGIVTTTRKFGRAQHSVKGAWRGFDTPLVRRDDIDWNALSDSSQWAMQLTHEVDA
jgi:hypothetical protein